MRFLGVLLTALLFIGFGLTPALADKRVVLVIGNGDYQHADKLANPVTDARRLRDTLSKLGFEIVYGENLDQQSLRRTIGRFANVATDADVALVYFAGHGATFGDVPYVVPVDAQFSSLGEMPYELVQVETLIGELRRAKGLRIAILDACRDNTAERELKQVAAARGGGEVTRGLARVKNPEGLILAYATQYMSTAADGPPNGDSPFTTALLNNIATPGLDVKDLFYRVGREVIASTKGGQRPEVSVSFYDDYALVPGGSAAAATPSIVSPPQDPAALAWTSGVKDTTSQPVLEDFIRRYGDSIYGTLARARLDELKKSQVAIVAPPTAPQAALAPPAESSHATSLLSGGALVQQIKKELDRVGCYDGPLDDKWPTNEITASIKRFATYAKVSISATDPRTELLSAIQEKLYRICPLQCPAGRVENEGHCIAKSCPAGQHLNQQGNCIGRSVATQHPTDTAEPAPPAATASRSVPTGARPKSELASTPAGDIRKTYPEGGQMCGPSGCRTVPKGCVGKKANGRGSSSDDGVVYC